MEKHIALLGDSIFDNKTYVPGGKSVHEHLIALIQPSDSAFLVAVDGAVISSVLRQIERVPKSTTHLVLSVGGNDALYLRATVMGETSHSVHASLTTLKAAVKIFQAEYDGLIRQLLAHDLPLTVCTVYDAIPGLDDASLAGLAMINDIITRIAFKHSIDLIDLRIVCNEVGDYSDISPIEPSHAGGAKIAAAILRSLSSAPGTSRVTV